MRTPQSLSTSSRAVLLALAVSLATACRSGDAGSAAPLAALDTLPSPAGVAAEPNLFAARDGRVHMSWLERGDGRFVTLRFATLDDGRWSEPVSIASGSDFFVNWADFPSIVELPDGRLAAHWLQRSGTGTYHYDIRLAQSDDGGLTWGEPVTPHRDGVLAEHGFVSLFRWEGDSLAAVWLDGRRFTSHGHDDPQNEMMLHFTTIAADGGLGVERSLDERVCECCQTAVAMTARGPVVVFRNRDPDEVRDIGIVRRVNGAWTPTALVHADGWHIPACPVNGPSVDAAGERVVVAWFTAPGDTGRVNIAFSDDAGETFAAPVRVDDGDPMGRVSVILDGDVALVTWMERVDEEAEVRLRRVTRSGVRSEARVVAMSTAARASGFPRMVRAGDQLVFAWTVAGDQPRVSVARGTLGGAR
jgi:hypothetical protein